MKIQGTEIKIGRPKAYSGSLNAMGIGSPTSAANATSSFIGVRGSLTNTYHPLDDNAT